MSNHYHLVLHANRARAQHLSREEIVDRWTRLFGLPTLVGRWREGVATDAEKEAAEQVIDRWRTRLSDVSWYMRCLNEYLARRANAEDECTGRFWEGRFKSQALLDEAGLLTAMSYVDLNPIRAGISVSPEESEFTSIYARIQQVRRPVSAASSHAPKAVLAAASLNLLPCRDAAARGEPAIPLAHHEYLQLVDWTGRILRADKRCAIDAHVPPILVRMNIDPDVWQLAMQRSGNCFGRALGRLDRLRLHARNLGQSWVKGLKHAERLYRTA